MYEVNPSQDAVPCYLLPEDSQLQLKQLRDHLQLLGALTQPQAPNESRAPLTPEAMAACFMHLAGCLDAALQTAWWAGFSPAPPKS